MIAPGGIRLQTGRGWERRFAVMTGILASRRALLALLCMVGVLAITLVPSPAEAQRRPRSPRTPRTPIVSPVVFPGGFLTPDFLASPDADVNVAPGVGAQQIVIPPFDPFGGPGSIFGFITELIQRVLAEINAILSGVFCDAFGGTACASP